MDTVQSTTPLLVKDDPSAPKKLASIPVEQGLMIRAPYGKKEWDVKNLCIGAPVEGQSKNGVASFYECKFEYIYTLPDGKTKRDRLQIELPNEPGKRAVSHFGITEVLEFKTEKELKELGPDYKREGTGKFSITCSLPAGTDTTLGFIQVMRDIYKVCLLQMYEHGSEGSGILGDTFKYTLPLGEAHESNTSDSLRFPIMFTTNETINKLNKKVRTIDTTGPVKVRASVKTVGRYAAAMVDKDAKTVTFDDVLGKGFEHVPLLSVDNLFIGARNKVRFSMDSTIIDRILPPRVMQQGTSIAEMKKQEVITKANLARDAQKAFDLNDDSKSEESSEDPDPAVVETELEPGRGSPPKDTGINGLPRPQPTSARVPITPVKSTPTSNRATPSSAKPRTVRTPQG